MSVTSIASHESTVRDYLRLLKPGVMTLVVFTGWAGIVMAPGHLHPFLAAVATLCIALGSGAGAAINMWHDRDIDAIMRRTRNRPIPAGRVHPDDALWLGLALAAFAVGLMGLAANWDAAALLAFAIWFYGYVYTMRLKRSTPQNIVIGGAAGAFPPVIGWLAVAPHPALEPWLYFLIVFLWTPPHFWALALYRHEDYRAASIPMLPVTSGTEATKRQMLAYSAALFVAATLPFALGTSGFAYLAGVLFVGALFLRHALRVWRGDDPSDALAMFKFSLLYLFSLFSLLVVDKMIDNHAAFLFP